MTDEQRVRSALEYDLEPWQPDPADLMRRGRRLAWLRRGLAAAGVTVLAGTVATVSAAVGGPSDVRNLLAGDGKPPAPIEVPTNTPSVIPTCLPNVPAPGKPSLPVPPAATPSLPGKPGKPTLPPVPTPSLPGKPTLPPVPTATPTWSKPPKPTWPTTTPSWPHTPPTMPTGYPSPSHR